MYFVNANHGIPTPKTQQSQVQQKEQDDVVYPTDKEYTQLANELVDNMNTDWNILCDALLENFRNLSDKLEQFYDAEKKAKVKNLWQCPDS